MVESDGNQVTFEVKTNDLSRTVRLRFSKDSFGRLLGIPVYPVNEVEAVPVIDLVNFINELGCSPALTTARLSDCKKANLPLIWNFFFGFCTRCLYSKTGGLDTASQSFWTLMFGLYTGAKVDYLSILWADFVLTVSAKLKSTHLASHRFWALVVHHAYQSRKMVYPADLPTLPIQFYTDKRVKKSTVPFTWVGQVSRVLLDSISDDSQIKRDYMSSSGFDPSYPKRPVSTEVVQPVEKKKRKTGPSEDVSPHKKKKRGDRPKKPTPVVIVENEPMIETEQSARSDPDPQWEEQEKKKKVDEQEKLEKERLLKAEKEKAAKFQKARLEELAKKRRESEQQEAEQKKKFIEAEKEKQRLAKIELEKVRREEEEEEVRLKAAEEKKRIDELEQKRIEAERVQEAARLAEIEKEKKAAQDKQIEDDRLKAKELEKQLDKEHLSEEELKKKREEEEESGFFTFTPPSPPTWTMGFAGKDSEKAGTSGSVFGADSPIHSAEEEEAEDEIQMGDFEVETDEDPDRDTDHVTRKEYKKLLNLFSILLSQNEKQAKEITKLSKSRSDKKEKAVE